LDALEVIVKVLAHTVVADQIATEVKSIVDQLEETDDWKRRIKSEVDRLLGGA
jgi:hypothetical protein